MKMVLYGFQEEVLKNLKEEILLLQHFPILINDLVDCYFLSPDAILIPGGADALSIEHIWAQLTANGAIKTQIPILTVNLQKNGIKKLQTSLSKIKRTPAYPKVPDKRAIFHAQKYRDFCSANKLKVFQSNFSCEMNLVKLQVEGARKNLKRAMKYFKQLQRYDQTMRLEISYRMVHGSYKIFWGREQMTRYLAFLAHFIPGVDLDALPLPAPNAHNLEVLKYQPDEGDLYAVEVIRSISRNEYFLNLLNRLITQVFTGQKEEELHQLAIEYLGTLEFLHQVSKAQIMIMEQFLDPRSKWHQSFEGELAPREIHRSFQLWADFYGYHAVRTEEVNFPKITKGWIEEIELKCQSPVKLFLEFLKRG